MRGGQWQAFYLMEGLAAAGHRQVLAAPAGSGLLRRAAEAGWETAPLRLAALWRLVRQAEIVHAHTGRAHALAAAVDAPRLVVSRRVAFPVKRNLLSRWNYTRPRRFLAVSEHVKRTLLDAGVEADRIRVVYDGAPELPPSAGGAGIVAPATDDPRKGASLLRAAAARAGVRVLFSADLVRDLSRADLFVYLSRSEGLGSGVLLAMSAGVAVIASRVGGLPELVEHGACGLLTENNPEAVAGAIRRLAGDAELRAAFGRQGRQRARERFSLERMITATMEVYREVLSC